MLSTLTRKLGAATVLVLVGLVPGLVAPAHADVVSPTPTATAVPTPPTRTVEISASSVPETQQSISKVLTENNAAALWPSVNADLTPKLERAVSSGGGTVSSEVASTTVRVLVRITCVISYPPLRIRCTIVIIVIVSTPADSQATVPARFLAKQ